MIGHKPLLEWLSALSIVALAVADLVDIPPAGTGALALACSLLHAMRLAHWRSLDVADMPLVWVLHLGFAWLCLAFLLFAANRLGLPIHSESWVHAFTVGGFGLMSLGLMVRVSRKHTGRSLQVPRPMVFAFLMLAVAAVVRVLLPLTSLREELLLLSALMWAFAYLIYLTQCGRMLLTPSLQRRSREN